jgi:hypothetical protein
MSCKDCEERPLRGAYYRWSNGNVEIVACEKHWREIREVLNAAQSHEPYPPTRPSMTTTEIAKQIREWATYLSTRSCFIRMIDEMRAFADRIEGEIKAEGEIFFGAGKDATEGKRR